MVFIDKRQWLYLEANNKDNIIQVIPNCKGIKLVWLQNMELVGLIIISHSIHPKNIGLNPNFEEEIKIIT